MSVKLEILIYRYIQASLMRRIRKYNELLSKDVAKAVGISIPRMSQIESGYWGMEEFGLRQAFLDHYGIKVEAFVKVTDIIYKQIIDGVLAERCSNRYLNTRDYVFSKVDKIDVIKLINNVGS